MAASRRIQLHSVLGPDQLMIKDATLREELGRLSMMDLDLLSPDENLALDNLLGQGFSVELALDGDTPRFFHGVVAECSQTGRLGRYARYSAKVVPWLWLLTRTSDCRIFQQQSVPDIIKAVFREHGTADFEDSLSGSYSPRDYCVQYMETDFDFVSRLMEEEGIYYFFKHEQAKDTLVLCDSVGAHSATPGCETLPFYPPSENVVRDDDFISDWRLSHSMQSGKLTHTDFDFTKPRSSLLSQYVSTGPTYPKSDAEVFAYPGGYLVVGDGSKYAQRRLEALQQQHERVTGSGNARGLAVGALFSLENYPRDDQNREYLVVSAIHHLAGTDYESGVGTASADVTVAFDAIPSKQPYRSLLTTRRARVAGPQTAIVVGAAGEEIYTDQYGRVKVQFHWDRLGKRDENSSCWLRVSQVWAGKNWGAMHIPRIGQEVIVSFLEGDPDRPIITGRVYNGAAMPPYDLPANMTQSGIKSRSSKGGSPANFNEICFEDKMGAEMLTIHAEKDQTVSVEHDEMHSVGHDKTYTVGNDRSKTITHDETTKVGNNRTETVGNNEQITIGVNRTESVGSNESITIGSNRTISVGASETATVALQRTHSVGINETISVGAAQQISIGAAQTVTVGAIQSISVGANQSVDVGANQTINVGAARSLTTGAAQTVTIGAAASMSVGADESRTVTGGRTTSVGKDDALSITNNWTISAGDSITITTGSASIAMKKDGTITISGKGITINDSGDTTHKSSGNITMKGSKILQN